MILISACLVGQNCKYNGQNNFNEVFEQLLKEGKVVPFCPEQAGGLPTPRAPSEIRGGDGIEVIKGNAKVINSEGQDVTSNFLTGAKEALKLAKEIGIDTAILKSKSPSCGCRKIYDGSFRGKLREGLGVTAAFLSQNGVKIIDSEEFLKDQKK